MNDRRLALALRKQRLLLRCAQQRTTLANDAKPLLPIVSTLDSAIQAGNWLRRHGAISGTAVGLLVIARPRFALRWGKRGFLLWQAWRRIRHLVPR